MFCCNKEKNETVLEKWILPFCLFSAFALARETNTSDVKLKDKTKKYPNPSRLTKMPLVNIDLERK